MDRQPPGRPETRSTSTCRTCYSLLRTRKRSGSAASRRSTSTSTARSTPAPACWRSSLPAPVHEPGLRGGLRRSLCRRLASGFLAIPLSHSASAKHEVARRELEYWRILLVQPGGADEI